MTTSQGGTIELAMGAPKDTKIFPVNIHRPDGGSTTVMTYWTFKDSFGELKCLRAPGAEPRTYQTPAQQVEKQRRFDAQRAGDIKIISEEAFNVSVGTAWRNPATPLSIKQPLPKSLDDVLAGARQRRPRISDPKTGTAYEYQVLGESTFRVCTIFEQARNEAGDVGWNHPAGRHCFDFDALNPRR